MHVYKETISQLCQKKHVLKTKPWVLKEYLNKGEQKGEETHSIKPLILSAYSPLLADRTFTT